MATRVPSMNGRKEGVSLPTGFQFLHSAFLEAGQGLAPLPGEGERAAGLDIIGHHHRAALALHLARDGAHGALQEREAFVAQVDGSRLDGYLVGEKDGYEEVGVDVGDDKRRVTVVHSFAEDSREISRLGQVVEGKIDGVVHMPQLVDVAEAELYGISVVEGHNH